MIHGRATIITSNLIYRINVSLGPRSLIGFATIPVESCKWFDILRCSLFRHLSPGEERKKEKKKKRKKKERDRKNGANETSARWKWIVRVHTRGLIKCTNRRVLRRFRWPESSRRTGINSGIIARLWRTSRSPSASFDACSVPLPRGPNVWGDVEGPAMGGPAPTTGLDA